MYIKKKKKTMLYVYIWYHLGMIQVLNLVLVLDSLFLGPPVPHAKLMYLFIFFSQTAWELPEIV